MDFIHRLFQRRDDRDVIRELFYKREDLLADFHREVQGLAERGDEYQMIYSGFRNEMDLLNDEIDSVETRRAISEAVRWRVPVPARPAGYEDSNEFWQYSSITGRSYLTEAGLTHLRREVYKEWEMWSKPWLSWGAIAISVISLGFSLFKP